MRGGGGTNFLTSDGLQIFFGALYHEMVLSSPEHKGSDNVEFLSTGLVTVIVAIVTAGTAMEVDAIVVVKKWWWS